VKPNLVPYDKFKIENQIKAFEFINVLRTLEIRLESPFAMRKVSRVKSSTARSRGWYYCGPDFQSKYSVTGYVLLIGRGAPVTNAAENGYFQKYGCTRTIMQYLFFSCPRVHRSGTQLS
jgi:hypothetical protein